MDYNFKQIESKWRQRWVERRTYHVEVDPNRPKYYVLDMFPYPSGARAQMPDMHGVRYGVHADVLSEADGLCAKRP